MNCSHRLPPKKPPSGVLVFFQFFNSNIGYVCMRYLRPYHPVVIAVVDVLCFDNARVFDLEVESSTGVAQYADRLFLSATTDGINYGREQMIEQNEPFVYDKRVLWKKVGRIRKNIGFKLRVITKSPVTLSGCQIRIE